MLDSNPAFVHDRAALEGVMTRCIAAGLRVSRAMGDRLQRGRDDTYLSPEPPDMVVFATSAEDVVAVVKACDEFEVPLMAFGAGTSTEGHLMARRGGVSVDLTGMDGVLSVSAADFQCTVQAGVTRRKLNEYLRDTGLFFPIDACAEASIGGMASTRASGTNAVRYGTMRENVVSMKVVLADGKVISTGSMARKSAAGYDLTRLFTGAGGTLGIITELTVRLYGIPEHVAAAVCAFPSIAAAAATVAGIMASGVPIAKVEIVDDLLIGMINAYSGTSFERKVHLFFEFDGTQGAVQEYAELARKLCLENDGSGFNLTSDPQERSRLWDARHKAWYAALAARPGSHGWPTDITVPISRMAEAIVETKRDLDRLPFPAPVVGHVGDGNFHVIFLVHRENAEEMRLTKEANDRMVQRAIDLGGTCTGEHGVGFAKNRWLIREYGAEGVELMRTIKRALDPKGILNPGKMFDE